tara:strand:- start:561 stop:851 length:291 start_codon:yes stop_codon:yes gene_type:complete
MVCAAYKLRKDKPMAIRMYGNDIEIDGEKVARVLDIRTTLLSQLEAYIDKADIYDDIDKELSEAKVELKELKEITQEDADSAFTRGYKEGKDDAAI